MKKPYKKPKNLRERVEASARAHGLKTTEGVVYDRQTGRITDMTAWELSLEEGSG